MFNSLVIREMQTRITLKFHLSPVKITKINKINDKTYRQGSWGNRNVYALMVGVQAYTDIIKISKAIPQEAKN